MCFLYLEEMRKAQNSSKQRACNQEVSPFFGLEVPGAFYSPGTDYKAVALQGPPPSSCLG